MLRTLSGRELAGWERWFGAHCVESRSGAIRSSNFISVQQTQLRKPGAGCRAASREPFGGVNRSTSKLNSPGAARSVVRRRGIREEIIGRSAAFFRARSAVGITRGCNSAFAVLHDPSREHRGHLFTQIGGVPQARDVSAAKVFWLELASIRAAERDKVRQEAG